MNKKKTQKQEQKPAPVFEADQSGHILYALVHLEKASEELYQKSLGFSISEKRKCENGIARMALSLIEELDLVEPKEPRKEAKIWLRDLLLKYKKDFSRLDS